MTVRTCRVCGCTEADCRQCIERTGSPCHWVEADLCSACIDAECHITVDDRNGAYTYIATGRWQPGQKIAARASCTSGGEWAAKACAAKMLKIPAIEVRLQRQSDIKPGYRQFTATKPKSQPTEDDDDDE